MPMSQPVEHQPGGAQTVLALLLIGTILLMSACSGDTQVRQRALLSQARFAQLLVNARQNSLPTSLLQPFIQKQQQLAAMSAPLTLFSEQPADDYYQQQTTQYQSMSTQLLHVITTNVMQMHTQALQDLQSWLFALKQAQDLPTQNFVQQFLQTEPTLFSARTPADYVHFSATAQQAMQAITALKNVMQQLSSFEQSITLLQNAQLDVTALQMAYLQDQEQLTSIVSLPAFQQLEDIIAAQDHQAITNLLAAVPRLSASMLERLDQQVKLLPIYRLNPFPYAKRLVADQLLIHTNMNVQEYQAFVARVGNDILTTHADLLHVQDIQLLQKFHQEVKTWGNSHLYYDDYNGWSYPLDGGYQLQGIGSGLDAELAQALTPQDFQQATTDINNAFFDLHMLEADYNDTTPYDQAHSTDMRLLTHYQLRRGQVLLVSLTEQAMRVYQDGQLVQAFQVTTGRPELPSLPGIWSTLDRLSPTVFRSGEAPSSPYWYPPTPIQYAILYHSGGYFVHDSWWRDNYGPGTQFPHADASGNQSFAGNGSHGCINMQEDQAAWVYNNTDANTTIVIY